MDDLNLSPADLLLHADRLVDGGQVADAVEVLTRLDSSEVTPPVEERLVMLRHRAAAESTAAPTPDGPWPPPTEALFPAGEVPVVDRADLDADVVRSALGHQGCLLVRGFVDPDTAADLLAHVHRAFDAARRWADGAPTAETTPHYVPFTPLSDFSFGEVERSFARTLGGVLTVESPRTLARIIEAFRANGTDRLLADYFGERAVLSAKKSTLRRADGESPTEWHQDGAFLGRSTRTLNTWVSLTPCGDAAPSIDVIPRAFDRIVATGTDDAQFDWSVGPEAARRTGDPVRPVFAAGDALLFDQLTLHRTGIDPSMTEPRYAIESWFFAASTYPYEQVPVLF